MKKLFVLVLAFAMVFCFTACGQTEDETEDGASEGVANPMTEYATLAEMNEAAGTLISLPELMQVTDESFSVIETENENIAQYVFTFNGTEFTLRSSAVFTEEDISGVYINAEPAFTGAAGDLEFNSDSESKVARWANIDGMYSLSVADGGAMDEEEFKSIATDIYETVNPVLVGDRLTEYFEALSGSWNDTVSQRATLEVLSQDDSAEFTVSWASSASETTTWTMHVTLAEDGLLYYKDCTEVNHVFDADGNENLEIMYTDGEGFFGLGSEDGLLYWNGAADEECQSCAFEKAE